VTTTVSYLGGRDAMKAPRASPPKIIVGDVVRDLAPRLRALADTVGPVLLAVAAALGSVALPGVGAVRPAVLRTRAALTAQLLPPAAGVAPDLLTVGRTPLALVERAAAVSLVETAAAEAAAVPRHRGRSGCRAIRTRAATLAVTSMRTASLAAPASGLGHVDRNHRKARRKDEETCRQTQSLAQPYHAHHRSILLDPEK
jgi:hypothetical protein